MVLTEDYLRNLLHARRRLVEEYASYLACDEMNQDCVNALHKEANMINRVLNGKETITIADDSVVEYFKVNSKLLSIQ